MVFNFLFRWWFSSGFSVWFFELSVSSERYWFSYRFPWWNWPYIFLFQLLPHSFFFRNFLLQSVFLPLWNWYCALRFVQGVPLPASVRFYGLHIFHILLFAPLSVDYVIYSYFCVSLQHNYAVYEYSASYYYKKHVDTERSASWVNKSRQYTCVLLETGVI